MNATKIFNPKIKRNAVLMIFLMMTVFGMGAVESTNNPVRTEAKNKKKVIASSSKIDFHTKLLLVTLSIFMLIFVVVLLVIGHFTWFADIRKKLEEEWEEELKAEEEKRVAKKILSEMINPFEDEETGSVGLTVDGEEDEFGMRRDSVDSAGCTRGQCVPPHHSILCRNNPNIPSLNEPFSFNKDYFSPTDPIDYRNRPSTEWMNLESSVKVSEPIPMRERKESSRMMFVGNNFSTGLLVPKPPMTPATPGPDASDLEMGSSPIMSSSPASPEHPKFDLSKIDML